jgi:hypothetical protein
MSCSGAEEGVQPTRLRGGAAHDEAGTGHGEDLYLNECPVQELRKEFSLLVSEVEQLKMKQAQAMEKIFSLIFN